VTSSVRSYNTEGRQGDLASRTLVLESKRFYLDVKENQRGRFIKVAEISADGRKNQILMTFSTAALFSQNLVTFIEFYQQLEKVDPENLKQGELKSEVMFKDDKKYHMDLKENARGRFLKVSETFTRGYSRFQVWLILVILGLFLILPIAGLHSSRGNGRVPAEPWGAHRRV
jgi:hypothetical protein